jgi:hypothetical protein
MSDQTRINPAALDVLAAELDPAYPTAPPNSVTALRAREEARELLLLARRQGRRSRRREAELRDELAASIAEAARRRPRAAA